MLLAGAPFLVAAIAWSGEDTLAGIMLLVLVVAAQVLGDSRRQRSQAIAERGRNPPRRWRRRSATR